MNPKAFKPAAVALAVSASLLGSMACAASADENNAGRSRKAAAKKPAVEPRTDGIDLRMARSLALDMPGVRGGAPTIIAVGPGAESVSVDEDIRRLRSTSKSRKNCWPRARATIRTCA